MKEEFSGLQKTTREKPVPGDVAEDEAIAEWEADVKEIEAIKTILLRRAAKKLGTQEGAGWVRQRAVAFADQIRKDHPDCERYFAYHLIAGSTPIREKSPLLGLPGDYDTEKFFIEAMGELLAMRDKS
ncbi:hypothetical protein EPO05_03680 [Patescibacteria group bacterium]|nr:MAG: hypothetical protein EPO05_03680 [Patescibacteria group bacterium]